MVSTITDINPQALKAQGIEGLILDLDNTLVLWQREDIGEAIIAWLDQVKQAGIKICLLSNSFWSKRSERIAERLQCPNVKEARKPGKSGFKRALAALGTPPHSTAIVGDQMFTDILGGNRMGIYTIMVTPMHPHEFVYTRIISRPPERLLLKYFKRRGHL
jgi:HAD superfamily phosphatase (TIGR01668 family)